MKKGTLSLLLTLFLTTLSWGEPAWAIPPYQHSGQYADFMLARQDGISWDALSSKEQELLKQHRSRWNSYSPKEQYQLRKGVQRYLDLPPEKRNAVNRKREQYQKMSPEERHRLRNEYQRQKNR